MRLFLSGISYLQPGMMSAKDEAAALGQLQAAPPQYVLLQYVPIEQILEVWPNSDRNQIELRSLRDFISRNYSEQAMAETDTFRLFILRRVD